MKFSEAMELLKAGSKVSRSEFKGSVYFKMVDGEVKSFQPSVSFYQFNEDIMVSDGWIIEDTPIEHEFYNVILALKQGLRVRFKDWTDKYIYWDGNEILLRSMINLPFIPTFSSFIAEDWIEL